MLLCKMWVFFLVLGIVSFPVFTTATCRIGTKPTLRDISARFYPNNSITEYIDIPMTDLEKLIDHSAFSLRKKTVIYIHGFTESPADESVKIVVGAYLAESKVNIIAIDWSKLSGGNYFNDAIPNAIWIGDNIPSKLNDLINNGVNASLLHIVSHSLGTHISGFIGKVLQKNYGIKLHRISALDPAGPGFNEVLPENRLDSSDALVVDVIHTDPKLFGFPTPLGIASFWPNSDEPIQPGCPVVPPTDINAFCSHQRSWRFWAESITRPKSFNSLNKDTNKTAYMGEFFDGRNTGIFRLMTASTSPFGLGNATLPRTQFNRY